MIFKTDFMLFFRYFKSDFVHIVIDFARFYQYNLNMIFKRKIYDKLLAWKNSKTQNSALLIEGARRVGKSTIVEEFAKREFSDYLLVDFRKESEEVKALFNNMKDLNAFFRNFFLSQGKTLQNGSLIIFDEIQFCPKARESIKDLVKDGRYRYIETGSLISVKENTENIMIPSEERRISMYPMDFEEFLWALSEKEKFDLYKDLLLSKEKISDSVHNDFIEKFRTYILIGGMPKVVSIFLETNSFKEAQEEQQDILKLYNDDLKKHDNKHKTICQNIFNAIPSQLAKENTRFVLSKATNKKRFEQIEQSLNDLVEYKIVNRVNCVDSLESPLSLHIQKERFKLYFCDIGLLVAMIMPLKNTKTSKAYFEFIKGKETINLGALYESVTSQLLLTSMDCIYYHRYTIKEKDTIKKYELDFVFESELHINALEIKSSKHYTTSSLDNIKKKYPHQKVSKYIFGIKNVAYLNDKTIYPIYCLNFLFD